MSFLDVVIFAVLVAGSILVGGVIAGVILGISRGAAEEIKKKRKSK